MLSVCDKMKALELLLDAIEPGSGVPGDRVAVAPQALVLPAGMAAVFLERTVLLCVCMCVCVRDVECVDIDLFFFPF